MKRNTNKNNSTNKNSKRNYNGKKTTKRPLKTAKVHKPLHSFEEKKILAAVKSFGAQGISSRMLLRKSGVKSKAVFYDALHNLTRTGDVKVDDKHRVFYQPPDKDVPATLISLSAGFGFARPENGKDDIFIHGSELKGTFVGDSILVTDVKKDNKGYSGRIKRIVKRAQDAHTGTVKKNSDGVFVVPDGAVRYNLRVKPTDLGGAKDGDKVLYRPKADHRGDWSFAAVKGVFGSGDRAKICADAIIESSGIPYEFSQVVLDEAEKAAGIKIIEEEIARRVDLRDKPIFTIDGADAKDLDDAISVEKTKTGYTLGVHIADVSHYVKERSKLDEEAYLRGTSVYFADRVIPMLPVALSNGVCSLNAGEDKLTLSAILHFDKYGEISDYTFEKTVISSKVRGVYSEVNALFAGTADKEVIKKYAPVAESLNNARELADLLKSNAKKRGEMELDSGEIKFVLDENGVCIDLKPRKSGEAETLIEHMMVSANTAAAKFAQKNQLPFLYRVHENPRPERLQDLAELLDRLGIACGEIKKSTPTTADFAAVLARVKGGPRESLVSQRVLRTMEKAKYAAAELGHFGLALKDYSHFTSPIRRYPDTAIHRILTAFLSGLPQEKIMKRYGEFAENAAAESSKNEIRAVTAERAAEDCYVAEYMKAHIGEKHTGIISGATARGIFVRLKNGAEGFVSLSDFQNADFTFDGLITHKDFKTGRELTVGEEIKIIIASSEVSSGRVDFVPDNGE